MFELSKYLSRESRNLDANHQLVDSTVNIAKLPKHLSHINAREKIKNSLVQRNTEISGLQRSYFCFFCFFFLRFKEKETKNSACSIVAVESAHARSLLGALQKFVSS